MASIDEHQSEQNEASKGKHKVISVSVTPIYAALIAILMAGLSSTIGVMRGKYNVALGDGNVDALALRHQAILAISRNMPRSPFSYCYYWNSSQIDRVLARMPTGLHF